MLIVTEHYTGLCQYEYNFDTVYSQVENPETLVKYDLSKCGSTH